MAKNLIVYFSRTGTTEQLARLLAQRLDADLDPVRCRRAYSGRAGFLRGVWDSLRRRAPAVESRLEPAGYATTIVMSPVWAGRLAAPMRGYLRQHASRIGRAAAVWVSGSGQAYPNVGQEIEGLLGHAPVARVSFAEGDIREGRAEAKLALLVNRVDDVSARSFRQD